MLSNQLGVFRLSQYTVKINSYFGADTRIQVVKERSPRFDFQNLGILDRDAEIKTESEKDESLQSITRKAKPGNRSQTRLSTHARALIQRIGGCSDLWFNPSDALFLTGTFPGESYEYQSAIAENAGWLINCLKAWIYKIIGANVAYWVWEFQERGTLHLHYVVHIPDHYQRAYIQFEFRNEWIRLMKLASARSGENLFIGRKGRDFFTEKELLQIYAQECYKSVASYLSKYLSKNKEGLFPAPCRLWGCTKEARLMVARSLISIEFCSKSIADASEIAWKYDSYSNVPNEKRRYFRHRFSEGFTILLYDDLLREDLIEKGKEVDSNQSLNAALGRLSVGLVKVRAYDPIMEIASPALKKCFEGGAFQKTCNSTLRELSELQTNLFELQAAIALAGKIRFYHVEEINNLIEAALCILKS